jgi:hypothetical protein
MLRRLGSCAKRAIRRQCGAFRQFCKRWTEFYSWECRPASRNSNSSGRNNPDHSRFHIPERNSKYHLARLNNARHHAKRHDSRDYSE